ncbi:hypothetical protein IE53DRAFT_391326 [Violaceomyces palustris]|uniref:Uncharacterized protein n=1 Tax=Violaceomyces palustris TaxID=1673888 RepID=A0ACD0NL29_9BASI|nr:hypothetical protein IE53DRAFT_391326 [Violaceomyces palustris]
MSGQTSFARNLVRSTTRSIATRSSSCSPRSLTTTSFRSRTSSTNSSNASSSSKVIPLLAATTALGLLLTTTHRPIQLEEKARASFSERLRVKILPSDRRPRYGSKEFEEIVFEPETREEEKEEEVEEVVEKEEAVVVVEEKASKEGTGEEDGPPKEEAKEEEEDGSTNQESAYDPSTGEINWDCPCLGGMAHGPCGEEFKTAFSCFVYSEQEPKGIECVEKFKAMQDCFRKYPEVYKEEIEDDDEDLESLQAKDLSQSKDEVESVTPEEVEEKVVN